MPLAISVRGGGVCTSAVRSHTGASIASMCRFWCLFCVQYVKPSNNNHTFPNAVYKRKTQCQNMRMVNMARVLASHWTR